MNDGAVPAGGESKSQATADISVKVYPVKAPDKSNLLAFASVTIGNSFAVTNIRVMDGKKGPFVAMPSKKGKDGQFHDTCFPVTAAMRENLNAAVMDSFQSGQQWTVAGAVKSDAEMNVDVKVHPVQRTENDRSNLLAYANVTVGNCFAVTDVRVMNGKNGPFVAMPSNKGKDGKFHDTCFPTTAAMREKMNAAVMGEYQRATQKESVRGAIQSGQREAATRPAPEAARARTAGAR